VYELTKPSNQRTIRTTAMVSSMFGTSLRRSTQEDGQLKSCSPASGQNACGNILVELFRDGATGIDGPSLSCDGRLYQHRTSPIRSTKNCLKQRWIAWAGIGARHGKNEAGETI